MADSYDDILTHELGKTGAAGGALIDKSASQGGSLGARFASKFLPTETFVEKLALAISPEKAFKLGYSVLAKLGELQNDDSKPPYPLLRAIIKSGFLNMNPAVIYLEILEGDNTGCKVTVTGAAKEGLIKQQTARKAVQRVTSALRAMANEI